MFRLWGGWIEVRTGISTQSCDGEATMGDSAVSMATAVVDGGPTGLSTVGTDGFSMAGMTC